MTKPETQEEPLHDFVDRAVRDLLSQPANLRGFLGDVVPDLVDAFDFDKMRPARREYFLPDWRSREADLLFEVPYRMPDREDWALVCILLEHQTKADWRTPLITLIYAVLYWEWQLRQWEAQEKPRGDFLLRPILPVVLHTGARPWGTVKSLRDLLVEPVVFRQFLPDWNPLFWEVAQHSTEQLLNSRDAFLQVLALFRVEDQEQAEAEPVFRKALEQLGPLFDTNMVRWRDLLKFVHGWAYNRRPEKERANWQQLAEQVQSDERRKREAKMIGMTIADAIRREGKAEGKAEGKLEAVLRQARKKWGEPDAQTLQTIQAISDDGRLNRMIDAMFDVQSWADLLNVT
jgi:hypothetical protein